MGLRGLFRRMLGRDTEATEPARELVPPEVFGYLVVESGLYAGQRFAIDRRIMTIGAIAGNDLVLAESGVSKRQCGIKVLDGYAEFADFGSTCGSWVNGSKVTKVRLRHLDRIRFGDVIARFYAIPGRLRDVEPWPEALLPELDVPRGAVRGPHCDVCASQTCKVKHLAH